MNLKREAQSLDYPGMRLRFERTVRFIGDKHMWPILDIGPSNDFGDKVASALGYTPPHYTFGDLNVHWQATPTWIDSEGSCVFCFEVIEHLKNPDYFLQLLQKYLYKESMVYVSFPTHRNSKYWSPTHFNEYDDIRAKELFEGAGYEIVRHESYIIPPSVNGIRPILRLPKSLLYLARQHLYELRLK